MGKKVREQWVVQFGEQWQVPNGVDGQWASGIAFEKFVGERRKKDVCLVVLFAQGVTVDLILSHFVGCVFFDLPFTVSG